MTHQTCIAPHRDNPPSALGGLLLCAGHHATLTEALTGPSAAEDPTIDCAWGVRTWWGVAGWADRAAADRGLTEARRQYAADQERKPENRKWRRPPTLLAGDGTSWTDPHHYRPGGLACDYTTLSLRLSGQTTGDRLPCVVHATEAPLPMSDAVAELRSQIRHDLGYWAGRHIEAGITRRVPADAPVAAVVAWLAIHRDWAAAQNWAGNYVAVLGELRARARALIDLPRAPRVDIGHCPQHGCDGTLQSTIREEHDPRLSLIRCGTCGHEWDSTQWKLLGTRLLGTSGRAAA